MVKKEKNIILLKNVCKQYKLKRRLITIFNDLNVEFCEKKFYAIIGESGAGKSTLINILGLLDKPTSGEYLLYDKSCEDLKDNEIADLRRDNIGLIFQDYLLNPYMNDLENVMLPMLIDKSIDGDEREKRALVLLEKFGLKKRITHMPGQLSGGEQQRVAIARALANNPQIILADEPTGNLDEKNEMLIFDLLKKLSLEGKCVIVVSHSKNIKKYADVIYEINNNTLNEVKYENK